jgi:hypothetical protein
MGGLPRIHGLSRASGQPGVRLLPEALGLAPPWERRNGGFGLDLPLEPGLRVVLSMRGKPLPPPEFGFAAGRVEVLARWQAAQPLPPGLQEELEALRIELIEPVWLDSMTK